MKYLSSSPSVQQAMNKTWLLLGVPLFLLLFGSPVLIYYLISDFEFMPSGFFIPVSIISGFVLTVAIMFKLSESWFAYYLPKVDNPSELYKRSLSNQMMWKRSADKVVKRLGVKLKDTNPKSYRELRTLRFRKELKLTGTHLYVGEDAIRLQDIKSYTIKPYSYKNYSMFYSHKLLLSYENGDEGIKKIMLWKPREFEKSLYEYIKNSKLVES